MSNILRMANVYVQDIYAGQIRETDMGYEFEYDEVYLDDELSLSISLSLPLQKEIYISKYLFPFFDGLIPEGWLLDVVINNWKVDNRDRFGLLMLSCRDCIGDVHIEPVYMGTDE